MKTVGTTLKTQRNPLNDVTENTCFRGFLLINLPPSSSQKGLKKKFIAILKLTFQRLHSKLKIKIDQKFYVRFRGHRKMQHMLTKLKIIVIDDM